MESPAETRHILQFSGFELDTKKQLLSCQGVEIHLSNKCYLLLNLLANSDGVVITKDELITAVWGHHQIVSDTSVNKLIARLKNTLKEANSKEEFIETVRGVGCRFKPVVTTTKSKKKQYRFKWLLTVIFLTTSVLFYWQHFNKIPRKDPYPLQPEQRVIVLPLASKMDWLNTGGLEFFSDQLNNNDYIMSLAPQSNWYEDQDKYKLAIDLTSRLKTDYVLLTGLTENETGFIIDLILRDADAVIAKTQLPAGSVKQVIQAGNQWLLEQLGVIEDVNQLTDDPLLSEVKQANENYFLGLTEAKKHNYPQAIDYFNVALNHDADFALPRLRLLNIQLETGQFNAALASLDTMKAAGQLDNKLGLFAKAIRARAYTYKEQTEKALPLLDEVLIASKDNLVIQKHALTTRTIINTNRGQYKSAIEDIKQELAISENYFQIPVELGKLHFNLSALYINSLQMDLAQYHVKLAQNEYIKANDNFAQGFTHVVMGGIYHSMGDFTQAQIHNDKAGMLFKPYNNPIAQLQFLQIRVPTLIESGQFSDAEQAISDIESLSQQMQKQEPQIVSYQLRGYLAFAQQDYVRFFQLLDQYNQAVGDNHMDFVEYSQRIGLHEIMVLIRQGESNQAKDKITAFKDQFPVLVAWAQEELKIMQALLLHLDGFGVEATEKLTAYRLDYTKNKLFLYAIQCGFHTMDIQRKAQFEGYENTLNAVRDLALFDYPLLRYQAQFQAFNNDFFGASQSMQQMKYSANELWTADDQLLLETYRDKTSP